VPHCPNTLWSDWINTDQCSIQKLANIGLHPDGPSRVTYQAAHMLGISEDVLVGALANAGVLSQIDISAPCRRQEHPEIRHVR
jgi:hypothetical protein